MEKLTAEVYKFLVKMHINITHAATGAAPLDIINVNYQKRKNMHVCECELLIG